MAAKTEGYHSILIVSTSEQFVPVIKKLLKGFAAVDVRKSGALARRSILEGYYDLVVINGPLCDETGEDLAIFVTEKCNASVLLVIPQDVMENVLQLVTDVGVLVIGKPCPVGKLDKAVRFLVATQKKIREQEQKVIALNEKMEEMRIVNKAKFLLIEEKHMLEDEAHRWIGKQAMDHGISRGRAARKILDEME